MEVWTEMKLENGKVLKVDWNQCSDNCAGWHHFGEPYEIQACTESGRFDKEEFPDEAARKAHREECGCQWPDFDFQDAAMAWVRDLTHYDMEDPVDGKASPFYDLIMELRGYCEERGVAFMDNLPHAIQACVTAIDKTPEMTPVRGRFGSLLRLLKAIREKIEKEELKLKDFGFPPDGKGPPMSIKKEMTKEEVIEACRARYELDSSIIDEAVYEAKAAEASDINNLGTGDQVEFLIDSIGLKETQRILLDHFMCEDPECPDAKENPYHDHAKED